MPARCGSQQIRSPLPSPRKRSRRHDCFVFSAEPSHSDAAWARHRAAGEEDRPRQTASSLPRTPPAPSPGWRPQAKLLDHLTAEAEHAAVAVPGRHGANRDIVFWRIRDLWGANARHPPCRPGARRPRCKHEARQVGEGEISSGLKLSLRVDGRRQLISALDIPGEHEPSQHAFARAQLNESP